MPVREVAVRRQNRWLALGGMVGALLFIPVAFIIGEVQGDYSHVAEGISALAETGAADAWAQTANFIIVGLLMIGLAIGLHRGIGDGNGSLWGPALIGAFGLGALVMNGLFPSDPVGAPETAVGTVHSVSAGLGFIAVIAAMFVLPRRLRKHQAWKHLASYSPLFGIASIVLMVSYLMAQEGAIEAWEPWTGLVQRGMGAAVLAWLFLLALRLFQTSAGTGDGR